MKDKNLHSLSVGIGFNFREVEKLVVTDIRYGSSGTSRRKVDLVEHCYGWGKVLKKNLKTTTILVQTGAGYVFPDGIKKLHTRKYVNFFDIVTIHVNEPIEVMTNDFVTANDFQLDLTPNSQIKAGNKS